MQKVIFLDFDGVLSSGDNSCAMGQLSINEDLENVIPPIAGFANLTNDVYVG